MSLAGRKLDLPPWVGLALACTLVGCGGDMGSTDEASRAKGVTGDGEPGQPGAAARAATPGSAESAATAPIDCELVPSGPRRLWRLTPAQYDNSVRDLFGIDSRYGAGFPADEVVNGFRNAADLLQVSPLLADKLKVAAQEVAADAVLSQLAPCAAGAANSGDDACLRELASRFGERVFRRPLAPEDIERYLTLAQSAGGFEPGARLMLQAMLQSPHFLYRFELGRHEGGTRFVLDDYEIASELSFLLWQTTPDESLLAAARSGQLHDRPAVEAQVQRLLQSPRARPVVRAFVFDWLGLNAISTVPKDVARFPELTTEVRAALLVEAERFVDHVMFEQDGSLSALLTTPVTFLDQQLAQFYGVPAPADEGAPVALSEQDRRGILTLGATMLVHARSNDSSPVHRGRLVRERLLCQTLPPPPPGIVVQPPPLDPSKTTRERYAAHSSVEPCVTCHRLMDPIGLVFEHFDGVGRYRADDNGRPIDASGEILGSRRSDGTFDGSSQLIDRLETSPDAQDCYSLSWLRFAYGLKEAESSLCVMKRVQDELGQSDGSLAGILAVLTQSEQFYTRTGTLEAEAEQERHDHDDDQDEDEPVQPGAAAEAEPPSDLELTLSQNNDWGGGYCKTYQLKNVGTAPLTWSIPLEVTGTINNHWECEISADTGSVTFTGAPHNATLQPGVIGQFGFCAMR